MLVEPAVVDVSGHMSSVFKDGAPAGQDLMARSFGRTRSTAPIGAEFGARLCVVGAPGSTAFTNGRRNPRPRPPLVGLLVADMASKSAVLAS
jgi:hypothetical protein